MTEWKNLPPEGFVRVRQIIGPGGPLPISRSGFYALVKAGRLPKPRKLGATSLWAVAELRACLARLEQANCEPAEEAGHPFPEH